MNLLILFVSLCLLQDLQLAVRPEKEIADCFVSDQNGYESAYLILYADSTFTFDHMADCCCAPISDWGTWTRISQKGGKLRYKLQSAEARKRCDGKFRKIFDNRTVTVDRHTIQVPPFIYGYKMLYRCTKSPFAIE